jgi:transposase-like protein
MEPALPQTLQEAIIYFADPDRALEFLVNFRWPNRKPTCPRCDCTEVSFISTRRVWKCKGCKKQFSVKVGTVLEDSPIGLDRWLPAIWLAVNCKNGISSYEIARDLGVSQKTAWFMLHRIRLALKAGSFEKKLCGEVEADETFVGGRQRLMNNAAKARKIAKGKLSTGGTVGKAIVMGMLERHGEARVKVVKDRTATEVIPEILQSVERGSNVYTDDWRSYRELVGQYAHEVINHTEAYVKGRVHTNGLENFWSLLKRSIKGTYVSVEPFHLFRYLDEQSFRYNARKITDRMRFLAVLRTIAERRLTYKGLIGQDGELATTPA